MKKIIIYIDGENLLHRVSDVLVAAKAIERKTPIVRFDFLHLLQEVLLQHQGGDIEIRYYGTRIKARGLKGKPRQKALSMAEEQRRLKRTLERQSIKFVMCGTLQWRDGHRCMHCGKLTPIFQEKGVDVQIAVDIVNETSARQLAVIVSSDSDLLPAIRSARQAGMRIEYVTLDHQVNWALARNTDKTYDLSSALAVEAYRRSA